MLDLCPIIYEGQIKTKYGGKMFYMSQANILHVFVSYVTFLLFGNQDLNLEKNLVQSLNLSTQTMPSIAVYLWCYND